MAGSFFERIPELAQRVGPGRISGEVRVSQLYARRQHQNPQYAHPQGGQAFFLRDALSEESRSAFADIARTIYDGDVTAKFIGFVNKAIANAADKTPVELGTLKRSGSGKVKVGGAIVYSRTADVPKMTRTQLNRRVRARHVDSLTRRLGGG